MSNLLNSDHNPHDNEEMEFDSVSNEADDLFLAQEEADELLLADDDIPDEGRQPLSDSSSQKTTPKERYWKVLVVDDEPEIHQVTQLALEGITFDKKTLTFISAYSGEEAKTMLQNHPDTAVVLLDVVMENNDSGLQVAKFVREDLENHLVRIILRTGQPGEAPEESIIVNYDINDYKLKMDLSQRRLFTVLISSLRSYRDLLELQTRQTELARLNQQLQIEIEERKKLEHVRFEKERLRLEKEFLETQAQELTKLNADKDKFFSIVAHDLKGPFTPLLGNAELLMEMADVLPPKDIKAMSASIHRAAKNISYLLKNLLEWARMQMGRMEYQPRKVDLQALIEQNIRLLMPNATDKQINLLSEVEPNLWGYADEYMIDTVIRNLTSNALKFTPPNGTVKVQAAVQQTPFSSQMAQKVISAPSPMTKGPYIKVSVSDTGVGIPPESMNKLFELGVYHTTTGTAHETGTGLGLIICQEMVIKNGGFMSVSSQVGQGTTFTFTLPLYFSD